MAPVRPALAAVFAAIGAGMPLWAQEAADVAYAGRVRALALDARCTLFADDVRIALEAGAALARNTLLRAGWSDSGVRRATLGAAAQTEGLPCNGPDAAAIVDQVEAGYEGWSRLSAMAFPGDQRTWNAARSADGEAWLLFQNVADGPDGAALLGLARKPDGAVLPALALPSELGARAARLNLRDLALSPTRVDPEVVRIVPPSGSHPLAPTAAPDLFTRAIWASDRTEHDAKSPYAEGFPDGVTLFWFPAGVAEDLAALDPREAAAIEIDLAPRGGAEDARRLYLEIGDFAPARLFSQAAPAPAF
jgi:hypothetical protein